MTTRSFDLFSLQFATAVAQTQVADAKHRLERLKQDTERAQRLHIHECQRCYYLISRLCGQAFTQYRCGWCGDEFTWADTCKPRFCSECAAKLDICIHCGSDVNLKTRRALERKRTGAKP